MLPDLTSVQVAGDGPTGRSQHGHSGDHRTDRPQVWLAVAADACGAPLRLEVLRGRRGDTTTLRQLQSIRPGRLELGDKTGKMRVTQAPKDLNDTLAKLDLLPLLAKTTAWTEGPLSQGTGPRNLAEQPLTFTV